MTSMELARRCAELNEQEQARRAYGLALNEELAPEEELEAASYIFFAKGDYRIAFTHFVSLFNRGLFQAELLDLMSQAFYFPNLDKLEKQYKKNVKALSAYPYLFRKDFPAFEDLPIWFFPFDNKGYIPYYPDQSRFGDYVDVNKPVVDRWFFKDLSKPILAEDIYSQYQLEYLNDNVRKSEWVAKENHIYLHYTDFMTFCAWLQVLNFKPMMNDQKLVFLMEEEGERYPIDFQKEFGIDYSEYSVKPLSLREIKKLIWHTQLSSHNGGDFFNEIFHGHPNLLGAASIMLDETNKTIQDTLQDLIRDPTMQIKVNGELQNIMRPTEKDMLLAAFFDNNISGEALDPDSRIVPALFFQPHFSSMEHTFHYDPKADGFVISSDAYDEIRTSPIFKNFKYIKTFTPLRRPTTSYGATIKFMRTYRSKKREETGGVSIVGDDLLTRIVNRNYMVDPEDRLYRDSRLVRFEDGKLNPTATFTALAEFLDIPYTESMTYCSDNSGLNPESLKGNDRGFSTAAIYRTYDEYCDDADRALLEYFLQDVYKTYGYDFHYYNGETVDKAWIMEHFDGAETLNRLMDQTYREVAAHAIAESFQKKGIAISDEEIEKTVENRMEGYWKNLHHDHERVTDLLLTGVPFVNKKGQPLQMMKALELDPELLEQPLYH